MGYWSDWVDVDPALLSAWGRFLTRVSYYRDPNPDFDEILESAERLDDGVAGIGYDPNVLAGGWVQPDHADDDPPRDHIQFLLGPGNEDPVGALTLPPLPPNYFPTLAAETRPTSGAYEWEADQGTHLGWAWDGLPTITHRDGAPIGGAIEVITPSSYFLDPVTGYDLTDHPHYPLPYGTAAASFGGTDPIGTELAQLPDPGPVFGFAVTINPELVTVEAGVGVTLGDLYARVQYPRWRYWIEQAPPLRQIQRGDNLGMGSARLIHPGTTQSSTRLFGPR